MYEKLESFDKVGGLLTELVPLADEDIGAIQEKWPGIPQEYIQFLKERGVGPVEGGLHFSFVRAPLDAASEVFGDDLVRSRGAKGPVCVFGFDHSGLSFGFDIGAEWKIVEIDEYRDVKQLRFGFREFVEELLASHPQTPSN